VVPDPPLAGLVSHTLLTQGNWDLGEWQLSRRPLTFLRIKWIEDFSSFHDIWASRRWERLPHETCGLIVEKQKTCLSKNSRTTFP
jgi:hypothetical protein